MNKNDIAAIVAADVKELTSFSNLHGITLESLKGNLVTPPVLKRYVSDSDPTSDEFDLWLVLEEDPINNNGYKIVYDPESQMYGLATRTQDDKDFFLGLYGNLQKALTSM